MDRLAKIYERLSDQELRLLPATFCEIAEAQRAATSEVRGRNFRGGGQGDVLLEGIGEADPDSRASGLSEERARYMALETIARLSDDPLVSLPALAS